MRPTRAPSRGAAGRLRAAAVAQEPPIRCSAGAQGERHESCLCDITFTPTVKAAQEREGSREDYQHAFDDGPLRHHEALGHAEQSFIQAHNSFFMATVSESGWPDVQHRGGPRGFVTVLDERTLIFPDFGGNRQLLSVGNLTTNGDRAALIMVDYGRQARLKSLGRLSMREVSVDDPQLQALVAPELRARSRRLIRSTWRPGIGTARLSFRDLLQQSRKLEP